MQPKNLLVIMSDEHNASFGGFAGHSLVKTPNLDRLARRGTVFTNAYTNCPICVPARASFATGQYVKDNQNWDNAHPYHGQTPSWGHRLIVQGHDCVSIGKLHYRDTTDKNGFSQEILPLHVVDGVGDLLGMLREPLPERQGVARLAMEAGAGESSYTQYDQNIADAASGWLAKNAAKDAKNPWVLFVSFVCPHFPLIAPQEYYDLYSENPPMPLFYDKAERPQHPFYTQMRYCINYDKYFDDQKMRKAIAAYMGLCTFMDFQIGKVLDALDATGMAADTRVLYTSDHGEALGKRGLWGKCTMYQESVAVPLIVAGSGVEAGARVATPVSLVDCFPTILDAVGAEPTPEDQSLPGRSLFAIARQEDSDRAVFSEYHAAGSPTACYMLRKGEFKLISFVGMDPQLFNLKSDPQETENLASDKDYAKVLSEMETELRQICDLERIDRLAKASQKKRIAAFGGEQKILRRGDFFYSPVPGSEANFSN